MQKKRIPLVCLAVSIILLSCNRNTDQLPPKKAPPAELVISAKINGLTPINFIFKQTKNATTDTVWLSVRNSSAAAITSLTYVVELCKALPQQYDNCDIQLPGQLTSTIPPGGKLENIYTWVNRGIKLDSTLINVGVISYSGLVPHPFGNIYDNGHTVFETSDNTQAYLGNVRGYVLADGTACFRLKGNTDDYFNAQGVLIQTAAPQLIDFTGLLKKGEIQTTFKLDSIEVGGNKVFLDNSNTNFNFRVKLKSPIQDTIQSLMIFTKRNF